MDLGLTDKCALVLASTRGLGRGIAEALAREGARVAVTGRTQAAARAAATHIEDNYGMAAFGYSVELLDADSVRALIDAVRKDFDRVDIVVNNSGGPPMCSITEVDEQIWLEQFRGMFLSLVNVTNAFLPGMRERGWGRVLISSSAGVVQPMRSLGISNTLRATLLSWAKALANEVAADGVTVNTMLPGTIETDRAREVGTRARGAETAGRRIERLRLEVPVGRLGTVEEYGAAAAFLASETASYITGSTVRVDGGIIRAP